MLLEQLPKERNPETNIWAFDWEINCLEESDISTLYRLIVALGLSPDPADGQYDDGVYWITI